MTIALLFVLLLGLVFAAVYLFPESRIALGLMVAAGVLYALA
jgi:hypothetical protein